MALHGAPDNSRPVIFERLEALRLAQRVAQMPLVRGVGRFEQRRGHPGTPSISLHVPPHMYHARPPCKACAVLTMAP